MIKKEDWMNIKAQIEKGIYQKDIAAELGVHPSFPLISLVFSTSRTLLRNEIPFQGYYEPPL
jgi:hypothetical protein